MIPLIKLVRPIVRIRKRPWKYVVFHHSEIVRAALCLSMVERRARPLKTIISKMAIEKEVVVLIRGIIMVDLLDGW